MARYFDMRPCMTLTERARLRVMLVKNKPAFIYGATNMTGY